MSDFSIDDASAAELVEAMFQQLSEQEREVLRLRFGLGGASPHTLAEVADMLRLVPERVRQIEARAMSRMRLPTAGPGTRDLLDISDHD